MQGYMPGNIKIKILVLSSLSNQIFSSLTSTQLTYGAMKQLTSFCAWFNDNHSTVVECSVDFPLCRSFSENSNTVLSFSCNKWRHTLRQRISTVRLFQRQPSDTKQTVDKAKKIPTLAVPVRTNRLQTTVNKRLTTFPFTSEGCSYFTA